MLNKNILLKLLNDYSPTKEEMSSKDKIINFVKTYDDCFLRSLSIGHITSSAWLLNNDLSKALLMHHRKLDMWVQPGGHCDGDMDVLSVAIKEAKEESGIKNIIPVSNNIFDIDIHFIPKNKNDDAHYHYDIRFLLKTVDDEKFIGNKESKELRWINKNKDELPTKDPSIMRMFDKWLSYIALR